MIGIGRDQFALRTQPIAADSQPMQLSFPVDVRALIVRGDEDARRSVRGLILDARADPDAEGAAGRAVRETRRALRHVHGVLHRRSKLS